MFNFNQYSEGRRFIEERPYCLNFQVNTYLARWVVRDIHQEKMDTQHSLYTEWVDQLSAWSSQEKCLQAILQVVAIIYVLAFASLMVFATSRDVTVSWIMIMVLMAGVLVAHRLFMASKERQQNIRDVRDATREMLRVETFEPDVQMLYRMEEETTCPKLKKYLSHHDKHRLYLCQSRGVKEYHMAQRIGEARG